MLVSAAMSEERDVLRDLTLETFQGRIGETFRVALTDGELELALDRVERLTEGEGETRDRTPFSLLFKTRRVCALNDCTGNGKPW